MAVEARDTAVARQSQQLLGLLAAYDYFRTRKMEYLQIPTGHAIYGGYKMA